MSEQEFICWCLSFLIILMIVLCLILNAILFDEIKQQLSERRENDKTADGQAELLDDEKSED